MSTQLEPTVQKPVPQNPQQMQQDHNPTESESQQSSSMQQETQPPIQNTQPQQEQEQARSSQTKEIMNPSESQQQDPNAPVNYTKATTKYPQSDPKTFGPGWWGVMQNVAAQYPLIPNRTDRLEFGTWYKFMVKNLPCQDPCRNNSYEYLTRKPLKFKNKYTLFESVIDFHNHVNSVTGKNERFNWRDMIDTKENPNNASNINTQVGIQNENPTDQASHCTSCNVTHDDSIKQQLEIVKNTFQSIANDVCKREGVPPVHIISNACPDGTDTSCITENGETFINPRNYSVKGLFHELDHYVDQKKKGIRTNDSMNPKADNYAYTMIKEHFPYDQMAQTGQISGRNFTHDRQIRRKKSIKYTHDQAPSLGSGPVEGTPLGQNKYQALVKDVYSQPSMPQPSQEVDDFPQFNATMKEIQKEEIADQVIEHEKSKGVLSHIDIAYEYPASVLGVSASDLNMMHTPQIIANSALTLLESFTTPATSLIMSVSAGLLMIFVGLLLKDKAPVRDLLFMQNLGGQFFWEVLRALNPKKLSKLKEEVTSMAQDMQEGTFSWKSLIETNDDLKKSADKHNLQLVENEEGGAPVMMSPKAYASYVRNGTMPQGGKKMTPNEYGRGYNPYADPGMLGSGPSREQLRYPANRGTVKLQPYQTSGLYY